MKITTNGSGATTGAASATIAIPNDSTGNKAKYVMITVQGATYVLPGPSGATATTSSMIVNADSPVVLDVQGLTHIAHLELTTGQRITVTPIEA
jgi:hypothetical protein